MHKLIALSFHCALKQNQIQSCISTNNQNQTVNTTTAMAFIHTMLLLLQHHHRRLLRRHCRETSPRTRAENRGRRSLGKFRSSRTRRFGSRRRPRRHRATEDPAPEWRRRAARGSWRKSRRSPRSVARGSGRRRTSSRRRIRGRIEFQPENLRLLRRR